jgi:hypothetical protein
MFRAQPFRPFEVRLADGQQIRIDHPEWAFLSPGGRTLMVYERGQDEHFQMVDVRLITTVEPVRGNGRKGRRRAG